MSDISLLLCRYEWEDDFNETNLEAAVRFLDDIGNKAEYVSRNHKDFFEHLYGREESVSEPEEFKFEGYFVRHRGKTYEPEPVLWRQGNRIGVAGNPEVTSSFKNIMDSDFPRLRYRYEKLRL